MLCALGLDANSVRDVRHLLCRHMHGANLQPSSESERLETRVDCSQNNQLVFPLIRAHTSNHMPLRLLLSPAPLIHMPSQRCQPWNKLREPVRACYSLHFFSGYKLRHGDGKHT